MANETLREKVKLMSGRDFWRTHASALLDVPAFKVTDGPNGARGDLTSGATSACFPVGVAMGASFDPALLEEIGAALGREAKSKACQALLGPTINLQRTPIGGRNFECYSEDPYLTGMLASAFVRGVQSENVAACPKHFVANDTEYERHKVSSNLDPRTLRELYLRPFEMVVNTARPWMIMSAYNRINGVQANANAALLHGLLKGEWGFDGVVVSDWGGSLSTVGDYLGGLDLEMPGPGRSFGAKLVAAIEAGEAPADLLEDRIARLKRLAARTMPGRGADETEHSVDRPEDRALARRAAIAGSVLLKNDALLPFNPAKLKRVAVIGPNAARGEIMGGGSAFVRPHYVVHPRAGVCAQLGDGVDVTTAPGCLIHKYLPAFLPETLTAPDGMGEGFKLTLFKTPDATGAPVHTQLLRESQWVDHGVFAAVDEGGVKSARLTATFTPNVSGRHELGVISTGFADIYLDGARVVENSDSWAPGVAFYAFGSAEKRAVCDLIAGRAYELELRFVRRPQGMMKAFRLGVLAPQADDLIAEAVAVARAADAVVLVLGANPDWETEGHDRTDMALPGAQNALAAAVLGANPNTVVVLNIGAAVDLPFLAQARAVLVSWFAGQEFGAALAAVLFGDAEPGGRLPFSWPARLADSAGYRAYVRDGLEMDYREGLFMGYRGHHAHGPAALFPFGHGLGYAEIAITAAARDGGDGVTVSLANASARAGSACVQVYSEQAGPDGARLRRLCGFARATLGPGETVQLRVRLDDRAFQEWDEAGGQFITPDGVKRLLVGRSATDIAVEI